VNVSDEQPAPPGVWGKVLLAVILLAIIGGSAGWLLAEHQRGEDQRAIESGTDFPVTHNGTSEDDGADGGGQSPEAGVEPGGECPATTTKQAGASAALSLMLHLRTQNSDVWICSDGERLFYQGYRGPPGGEFTDDNSLFLTDVVAESDGYRATNTSRTGTTTYIVSRSELIISDGAGERREAAVS
jgi:hypothetical protein